MLLTSSDWFTDARQSKVQAEESLELFFTTERI